MIKVVLMDIDDTLLSFSGYVKETMKEGFSRFGLPEYDDAMYAVFRKTNDALWRQIEQGTLTFDELLKFRWNKIFRELKIDFDGTVFEKFFRAKLFDSAILEPGATDLLDHLCNNYILCVASNGPFEQQINRLRVGQLYGYFDHFFISEAIGAQKPSREFFDFCMERIREKEDPHVLPEEVMMIGDSVTSDIAGGKRYGFKTCLYAGAQGSAAPVAGADHVVDHLSEIKQFL